MDTASGGWLPSGSCSLFVCDIASFGHASRTDEVQEHVRAAMYRGLRDSFEGAGVGYDDCYLEDRGDGAMIAVPPDRATALLLTSVVDRLRAEMRRHNGVSNEAAQIRLRVAVHTGEVRWDGNGLVGTAVNHVFRLLDAAVFKQALSDSGASVALIVSQRVHEDVVKHGRGLVDPGDYRQVEIRVKETQTTAWIMIPGISPQAAGQAQDLVRHDDPPSAPWLAREGDTQVLFELVDRTLDIPLMRAERGREQVVSALSIDIAVVIPRSADARSDVHAIIRTCLDYAGGLQELLLAIKGFVGDSMAMQRLEQTIARLLLQ
jgi:class 3 adenylate cyclase